MMRTMKLGALALALLAATAAQTQASLLNFDFSITNTIGDVSGTVTGEILGLSDNSTGPAAEVLIDTFPAGLNNIAGPTPINATLWTSQDQNSFTVSAGQVIAGGFWAENGIFGNGNFFQLYINGDGGPYNFVNLDGNDGLYVWGDDGFAAANIVPAGSVTPEPATLTLLGTGFFAIGGFGLLRRRRGNAPRSNGVNA
jgi:hypothetical protein